MRNLTGAIKWLTAPACIIAIPDGRIDLYTEINAIEYVNRRPISAADLIKKVKEQIEISSPNDNHAIRTAYIITLEKKNPQGEKDTFFSELANFVSSEEVVGSRSDGDNSELQKKCSFWVDEHKKKNMFVVYNVN